jgi:hypothetical protein
VGTAPRGCGRCDRYLAFTRKPAASDGKHSPAEHWTKRKPIEPDDPAWTYLAGARALPASVLAAAARHDCIRQGAYGSAWFAHRDEGGTVSHVDIRGPDFKGSLRGGRKTLLRFRGSARLLQRLAMLEAPIDALSLAAMEETRADTLYVAKGGGMGPGTVAAIQAPLAGLREAGGVLVSGTDANAAGDRYAERHAALAAESGIPLRAGATAGRPGLERHRAGEGSMSDVLAGLTHEQATAASLTGPVLVLAGAGTGKTKTLSAGIAHRIARRAR